MNLNPFRRRAPAILTASDHARALGQAKNEDHRRRVRERAREICKRIGMPVPDAIKED